MISITAKLIEIQVSEDKKFTNLIFESKTYNYRLKREVDDAVSVSVSTDHLNNLNQFRSAINSVISVPVIVSLSKQQKLWYRTASSEFVVQK